MTSFLKLTLLGAGLVALSACTMTPRYERTALPVPDQFPTAATAQGQSAETLPWRQVFLDERLQGVIEQALANNRDLRVAVLNVEKARSQYRIQRASLFPAVNGTVSGTRGNTGEVDSTGTPIGTTELYSANIGASWELDLFGRVRSLSQAALQSYFAVAENRKAAQISLISAVGSAWMNLAADQDQLRLSVETLRLREESLSLTQKRFDLGSTDQMTLRQSQVLTEQARADRRPDGHGATGQERPAPAGRGRYRAQPAAGYLPGSRHTGRPAGRPALRYPAETPRCDGG